MTKENYIKFLQKLPEDLCEATYVIVFNRDCITLQMKFNANLLAKYIDSLETAPTASENGYIEWELPYFTKKEKQYARIVMT